MKITLASLIIFMTLPLHAEVELIGTCFLFEEPMAIFSVDNQRFTMIGGQTNHFLQLLKVTPASAIIVIANRTNELKISKAPAVDYMADTNELQRPEETNQQQYSVDFDFFEAPPEEQSRILWQLAQ